MSNDQKTDQARFVSDILEAYRADPARAWHGAGTKSLGEVVVELREETVDMQNPEEQAKIDGILADPVIARGVLVDLGLLESAAQ